MLHHHSHVDTRYKRPLLNTRLNRAFQLLSTWKIFSQGMSTIRQFIESKVSEDSHTQVADKREVPIRIVLPYKDQKSANVVRKQLDEISPFRVAACLEVGSEIKGPRARLMLQAKASRNTRLIV